MALAAVRTLTGARENPPVQAVPQQPDLAQRLAAAQKAAAAPARRVGELEAALAGALEARDYAAAQGIKEDLAGARQEHAIAAAAVTALQAAIAEIGRQRAEDNRAIEAQRQRDAAQRKLAEARRLEAETAGELDAKVEHFWAALRAARDIYREACQLEEQIGRHRQDEQAARVALGEIDGTVFHSVARPNKASVLADHVPVVRELMRWSR